MDSCLRRNDGEKQRGEYLQCTMYDLQCTMATLRGLGLGIREFFKTEEKSVRDLLYKELRREGEP